MMKRRSKPAIYRVRLDGCSKDERYRTDNSRAHLSPLRLPRESFFPLFALAFDEKEVKLFDLFNAKCVYDLKCVCVCVCMELTYYLENIIN